MLTSEYTIGGTLGGRRKSSKEESLESTHSPTPADSGGPVEKKVVAHPDPSMPWFDTEHDF